MESKDFKKDKVVGSLYMCILDLQFREGFFVGDKFYSSKFLEHWSVAKLRSMVEQSQIFYATRKT